MTTQLALDLIVRLLHLQDERPLTPKEEEQLCQATICLDGIMVDGVVFPQEAVA